MTETRVDKQERKKLKVTWVKPEPEKFGQYGKKLRFNCEDGLQYETIKPHLFIYIKQGTELDADTELQIVKFDDGGEMPKWVVTEIYEDGKPVEAPAKGSRGGATTQYRGRDEDRVDQRTFVMEVGQDLRAGLRDKADDLVTAREIILMSWVGFKAEATPQPKTPKPETPIIDMPALKAQVTDLLKTKKITSTYLKEKYGISKLNGITNLSDELKQEFIKEIQDRLSKTS